MIDIDARDVLGVVAVVAGGGAVAVLMGAPLGGVSAVIGLEQIAPAVGLFAVATAGWLLRDRIVLSSRRRGPRVDGDSRGPWDDPLVRPEPERIELGARRPLGAAITIAAEDDDILTTDHGPEAHIARIRAHRRLREAVEHELVAQGLTKREASERMEAGTWTDDDRAAAFLAEGPTPSLPPLVRLRDWFAGERTARGVRAAVRELERLTDRSGTSAGERDDAARPTRRTVTAEASAVAGFADEPDTGGEDARATEETERERVYPKPQSEVSR